MMDKTQLNKLFQYAFMLCKNHNDAHDLLQNAIEKYLVVKEKNTDKVKEPLAYIRSIIRNQFIDQVRRNERFEHQPFTENTPHDISPCSLEEVMINQNTLEKLWLEIDPIDRDILYHWAALGYSTKDSADAIGIAHGTLLSRMHRLRQYFSSQEGSANLKEGTHEH